MSLFRRLLNLDKVESLKYDLDEANEANAILKAEVAELKEYRLKYKIAQMYIDDDEALLELITAEDVKASKPAHSSSLQLSEMQLRGQSIMQAAAMQGFSSLSAGQAQAAQMQGLGYGGIGRFL